MFKHLRLRRANASGMAVVALLASRLVAQSADTVSYVTTQARDTIAIEQYVRRGNAITGAWIQHQGGLYVHDYALALGDDGWPRQYVMTLYTTRPHTFLFSMTYGADSATRIVVRDASAGTDRVRTQKSYPMGALSIVGMALAVERARQSGADSTTIILDRETRGPSLALPVRFYGGDSVRIGAAMLGRVDPAGHLLALHDGSLETRRVPSLPAAKLVAGFVAADSAARAARRSIVLPHDALQRFVGEYTLNPGATFTITLDDDKLMVHVGNQAPSRLVPSAPTAFYLDASLGATFEFEIDASGNVTALNLVQASARQRAVKTK